MDWELPLGSIRLEWNISGDEWMRRFEKAFKRHVPGGLGGYSFRGGDDAFEMTMNLAGARENVVILGQLTPGRLELSLAGEGVADDGLTHAVKKALRAAESKMGRTKEYRWTALIGHPAHRAGFSEKRLAAPAQLGDLHLISSETLMIEVRPHLADRMGHGLERSFPIEVRGRSAGYSWMAAQMDAGRQLRRLCGLLSVVWEMTAFEVKLPPVRGDRIYVPEVPSYTSLAALRLDKEEDEGFFRLSGELVELPTWLDDAAALLLKKPWLANALDGYLEGVYARPEHPSLALICFTSAVESVATRIFYEEVCPECRSRRNLRRIYTEGLRVLLSREAAARLDNEYVARSKTAHTGKLHGMEAMPGVPMFLDWSGADEVSFYGRVWRAEAAAREVLLAALQDRLPARTHLPEPEPR